MNKTWSIKTYRVCFYDEFENPPLHFVWTIILNTILSKIVHYF